MCRRPRRDREREGEGGVNITEEVIIIMEWLYFVESQRRSLIHREPCTIEASAMIQNLDREEVMTIPMGQIERKGRELTK